MKWQKISLIIVMVVLVVATAISPGVGAAYAESSIEVMSVEEFREATLAYTSSIPENAYGGAYYDEAGNLVIHIKEGAPIPPMTGMEDAVREKIQIKTVKYTLVELEAMKDALVPYMLEYDIASLDANEVTTTIDIELWEEREDLYALIAQLGVIDMDLVRVTVLEDVHFVFPVASQPPEPVVQGAPVMP